MNNKRIISLVMCFVVLIVGGSSVRSFAESPSETNVNAEQHFEKANELYDAADYDGAVGEYEKVITISPNGKIAQNARYWVGQSHFAAGEFDAALAAFQGLASEYPTSAIIPSTQVMIGRVEQSKEEKAIVEAIEKGDLEQLKLLVSKGADVNARVTAEGTWTINGEVVHSHVNTGWPLLNLAIIERQVDIAEFLINQGADVNGRDGFGNHKTPLHYVAHRGTAGLAKLLIAKGADVNAREGGDYTPLYCVTFDRNPDRDDQLEVAKLLIANGADIEAKCWRRLRPLHSAAQNGRLDVAELLISKGANIEAPTNYAFTPLMIAVQSNKPEMVKLLLEKGALINGNANGGWTALRVAVGRADMDMVKLLLARGANPGLHGLGGTSILAMGMYSGQQEMVKFLIEKGLRYSPVHIAAFSGEIDKVKSYLAGGGDINAQDPSAQFTLLMCALLGKHKQEMEFLISEGADLNLQNCEGFTVLHLALLRLLRHDTEIVKMLLDKGADTEVRTDYGETVLYWAVSRPGSDTEILKMLLAKGADANARASYPRGVYNYEDAGWTPLHQVCSTPWKDDTKDRAELLITHGADINAKSKNGVTPLAVLKKNGSVLTKDGVKELDPDLFELVEFLREHGAKE